MPKSISAVVSGSTVQRQQMLLLKTPVLDPDPARDKQTTSRKLACSEEDTHTKF